jgi:hypothetical protein
VTRPPTTDQILRAHPWLAQVLDDSPDQPQPDYLTVCILDPNGRTCALGGPMVHPSPASFLDAVQAVVLMGWTLAPRTSALAAKLMGGDA